MAAFQKQLIALVLVATAVALYLGIGAFQAGGIKTFWGRLPKTGHPLVIVTERYASESEEVAVVTPGITTPTPIASPTKSPIATPQPPAGPAGVVLAAMNARRAGAGVDALSTNAVLTREAQEYVSDMVRRGFFDHTDPNGVTFSQRMEASGYSFVTIAENLGLTSGTDASVVVGPASGAGPQTWMGSDGHRANMLNTAFREVGVGVATGDYQGMTAIFVVAIFATSP